jgi:hypothetical protein
VQWFSDPPEADEQDRARYAAMTPQQRMDEMCGLLNRWGKWIERRLEKVVEILELDESVQPPVWKRVMYADYRQP